MYTWRSKTTVTSHCSRKTEMSLEFECRSDIILPSFTPPKKQHHSIGTTIN